MRAEEFRDLALSLPEATEGSHMEHPDFRVAGKIFATLGGPELDRGMVKLTPEQQAVVVAGLPGTFTPVPGGWGRRGATHVLLDGADLGAVQDALALAWRNTAPRRLAGRHPQLGIFEES